MLACSRTGRVRRHGATGVNSRCRWRVGEIVRCAPTHRRRLACASAQRRRSSRRAPSAGTSRHAEARRYSASHRGVADLSLGGEQVAGIAASRGSQAGREGRLNGRSDERVGRAGLSHAEFVQRAVQLLGTVFTQIADKSARWRRTDLPDVVVAKGLGPIERARCQRQTFERRLIGQAQQPGIGFRRYGHSWRETELSTRRQTLGPLESNWRSSSR